MVSRKVVMEVAFVVVLVMVFLMVVILHSM